MARTERRAVLGSSKRKLVQVAAAMAAAAAGTSARSAPASTSQRQRNHAAREAVCNPMRLQLYSGGAHARERSFRRLRLSGLADRPPSHSDWPRDLTRAEIRFLFEDRCLDAHALPLRSEVSGDFLNEISEIP